MTRRQRLGVASILVLVVYATIQSFCVGADFFSMDDYDEFDFIRRMDSVSALFKYDAFHLFRPIKNLIFWVFVQLDSSVLSRMTAIFIGILTFFPVRALGRRIFGSDDLALAMAAVWLLAPTQVSCVAWLSCVNIQIMAGFCALAFVLHDRSGDIDDASRWIYVLGAAFFYALSLVSYECAITLPCVFFLSDWALRKGRLPRTSVWFSYGVYAVVAIAYLAVRSHFAAVESVHGSFPYDVSRGQMIAASALFLVEHLHSWIWPFGRMAVMGYYSPWITPVLELVTAWIVPVVLLVAVALTWCRFRLIAFGILSFFILYLPVSNLLGLGNGPYGDYYLAIAGFGLAIAFVELVRQFWMRRKVNRPYLALAIVMIGTRIFALPEAAMWAKAWGDPVAAYANGLKVFSNSVNNEVMLVKSYAQRGDLSIVPKVADYLEQRLRTAHEEMASFYLVKALYAGNELKDAVAAMELMEKYREALPRPPVGLGWYHYYRGCLLEDLLGDIAAAKKEYELSLTAERVGKRSAPFFDRAALVHAKEGHFEIAIPYWEKAVYFDPKFTAAHYNLSIALKSVGRNQESDAHHAIATQLIAEGYGL